VRRKEREARRRRRKRRLELELAGSVPPIGPALRQTGLPTGVDSPAAKRRSPDFNIQDFVRQQQWQPQRAKEPERPDEVLPEPAEASQQAGQRWSWLDRKREQQWLAWREGRTYEAEPTPEAEPTTPTQTPEDEQRRRRRERPTYEAEQTSEAERTPEAEATSKAEATPESESTSDAEPTTPTRTREDDRRRRKRERPTRGLERDL
jgi:hypothetical protein